MKIYYKKKYVKFIPEKYAILGMEYLGKKFKDDKWKRLHVEERRELDKALEDHFKKLFQEKMKELKANAKPAVLELIKNKKATKVERVHNNSSDGIYFKYVAIFGKHKIIIPYSTYLLCPNKGEYYRNS